METIDAEDQKLEAVLRLSELNTKAVQVLSKHWIVTVEQQNDEIVIMLYRKEWDKCLQIG